jgi:hypothetical protein
MHIHLRRLSFHSSTPDSPPLQAIGLRVPGEFAIAGSCPTHDILRRDLFAFETQRVCVRNRCNPKHGRDRDQVFCSFGLAPF